MDRKTRRQPLEPLLSRQPNVSSALKLAAFEILNDGYILQRLLCLDLYDCQQAIICLLQILRLGDVAQPFHSER